MMKKITRLTLALMIPFALYAQSGDEAVPSSQDCAKGINTTCEPLDTIGAGMTLKLTVYLEGAFTGNEMSTELNQQGKIPLAHPFGGPPWNWPGLEAVNSIPNEDIVDWVLVDLRDATEPGLANMASTCGRKAGFLLKNGKVVDLDGTSPIFVPGSALWDLFIVVWHRNHMGILSANPLPCSVYTHAYDFSADSSQVYGGTLSYKELSPGIWGMVTGDSDANGLINDDDKINWSLDAGLNDYISNDFNVDGEVDNQDKDIWEGNRSYITQIPE